MAVLHKVVYTIAVAYDGAILTTVAGMSLAEARQALVDWFPFGAVYEDVTEDEIIPYLKENGYSLDIAAHTLEFEVPNGIF